MNAPDSVSPRVQDPPASGVPLSKLPMVILAVVLVIAFSVSCALTNDAEFFEVVVGPELRDCNGAESMQCMMVNGEPFMGMIEGFLYQEGYDYILKVERFDIEPEEEDAAEDVDGHGYRLVEIVSKTRRM